MTGTLVAYYSWSGNTAKVAKAVAEALGADIEEIREIRPRRGVLGYVRAAMEAAREHSAPIQPALRNAADYDLVVLGCPVWAQKMASPMRAYLLRERAHFKRIGLFCTLGGAGGEAALAGIASLSQREPIATLQVEARLLQSSAWRAHVDRFAQQLRDGMSESAPVGS